MGIRWLKTFFPKLNSVTQFLDEIVGRKLIVFTMFGGRSFGRRCSVNFSNSLSVKFGCVDERLDAVRGEKKKKNLQLLISSRYNYM